jgi:hypothetical protein
MKGIIPFLIAATVAVGASPASACRGVFDEKYTFLPALPDALPGDAVVLKVRPKGDEDVTADTATVLVNEVVAGDWRGDEAVITFGPFTSCSRREFLVTPSYAVGTPSAAGDSLLASEFHLSELRGVQFEGGTIRVEPARQ